MDENRKNPGYSLDEILAETSSKKGPAAKASPSGPPTQPAEARPRSIPKEGIPAREAPYGAPASRPIPTEEASQKKKRGKEKIRAGEEDIYYGLKLKPREEYQRQYEETMSFKPIRPDQKAGSNTSTFSYLFDPNRDQEKDRQMEDKFRKLHEERRQRLQKVVSDPDQEDIFSITTAISLKEIQEAAAKRGSKTQYRPVEERSKKNRETEFAEAKPGAVVQLPQAVKRALEPAAETDQTLRNAAQGGARAAAAPKRAAGGTSYAPRQPEEPRAPMREPSPPRQTPLREPSSAPVREPDGRREPQRTAPQRPVSVAAIQRPLNAVSETAGGASYRRSAAPIHAIPLSDFQTPLLNEADTYARDGRPVDGALDYLTVPRRETPAAAQDPSEEETAAPRAARRELRGPKVKKSRRRFRFSGYDEPEADSEEELLDLEEELDDYTSRGDAPAVFHDLGASLRELSLRLAVTGIATALLLLFGFIGEYGFFGLPKVNITVYLICNLVFLFVAEAFCGVTIFNGIKALCKFRANSDSGVAVAASAALIQSITALFMQNAVGEGILHLYSGIAIGALFLNTLGKFSMVKRINKNFHFVASPDKKYAVNLYNDHNTGLQMADGSTLDTPVIAYQAETDFLSHFLRLSYADDPSDRASQTIAPIAFVSSLILCVVTLFLTKDLTVAFTAFTAAACISTPVMNMLAVNLPLARISRLAAQCGGMVVGFPAVQHFSETNAVLVDVQELFPKNTVTLNGIKTFKDHPIDDALTDAAALMLEAKTPLSSLFDQIIRGRRDQLPKIDNLEYEDKMGISGWIGGRRIFVGNHALLVGHGITPPEEELEQKYIQGGKHLVYLAIGGDLIAMFIITYSCDRRRAQELRRMENNGLALLVRSCDPNLTTEFLSQLFGLDPHGVRVLPERLGSIYRNLTREVKPRQNALVATKGRPTALMRLLTACVRERGNISIAVVLQNVAVCLGFVMVAFLTCYSGLQQVSTLSLLVYEAFWALVIWLVPKLRKL